MSVIVRLFHAVLLACFFLLAAYSGAAAQTPPPVTDDQVNAVARELYCPVCENTSLDVCPTKACTEWRELIRLKLGEGMNKEQIKAYFAAQYGDRVLPEPPRQGLYWLIYVVPPLFVIGGALLLYRSLKPAKARRAKETPRLPAQPESPYLERMEEILRKHQE